MKWLSPPMSNNSLPLNAGVGYAASSGSPNNSMPANAGVGVALGSAAGRTYTTTASTSTTTGTITSIGITGGGSGYTTAPVATFSAGSILMASGGGGGGGSAWSQTPQIMTVQNELIIYTGDGGSVRVAETLTNIMDLLGLLRPDTHLIEKYPSLKSAWEDYRTELDKSFKSPELQAAINSYKMTAALVKADESGDS